MQANSTAQQKKTTPIPPHQISLDFADFKDRNGGLDPEKIKAGFQDRRESLKSSERYPQWVYVLGVPQAGVIPELLYYAGLSKEEFPLKRFQKADHLNRIMDMYRKHKLRTNHFPSKLVIYLFNVSHLSISPTYTALKSLETKFIEQIQSFNPDCLNKQKINPSKNMVLSHIPVEIIGVTRGDFSAHRNIGTCSQRVLGERFQTIMRW
jgi:hypothetical protein